jgi:hypothetical protein
MRKITLLLVTLVYLSSITEVHELLKATNLISHFLQHRESDESLSFMDFLSLHYGDGSSHADSAEHSGKLPFKSDHITIALANCMALPSFIVSEHVMVSIPDLLSPTAYYCSVPIAGRSNAIWQPPKMV